MRSFRRITLLLLGLDFLALALVFNVVAHLRGLPVAHPMLLTLLVPFAIFALAVYLIDGYRPETDMMSLTYTSQHVIAGLFAALVTVMMTFVILPSGFPLQSSRLAVAISYVLIMPLTILYRRRVSWAYFNRKGRRVLLFLGGDEMFADFVEDCRQASIQPVCVQCRPGATPDGTAAALDALLEAHRGALDGIVVREGYTELPQRELEQLVRLHFEGIPTYTLEHFHQRYFRKIPLYRLNPVWLFQEGFLIARDPVYERIKRVTDVALAAAGLLAAAPLFAVVIIAIWIQDRGGRAFYMQARVGRHRKVFMLAKFRTMREGADREGDYARRGDARITPLGRFLRHTRIDELPQLWNVLKGDMSLIGPRAEWVKLVEGYEREIPRYYFRHLVKPGITGWAQVNYPYGESLCDTTKKLEYDLYYIRHFSFVLEASIIIKTIQVMLFGKGR